MATREIIGICLCGEEIEIDRDLYVGLPPNARMVCRVCYDEYYDF